MFLLQLRHDVDEQRRESLERLPDVASVKRSDDTIASSLLTSAVPVLLLRELTEADDRVADSVGQRLAMAESFGMMVGVAVERPYGDQDFASVHSFELQPLHVGGNGCSW